MRTLRIAGGFALLCGGAIMMVTPGPGLLAIVAGLELLKTEYAWAQRIFDAIERGAARLRPRMRG